MTGAPADGRLQPRPPALPADDDQSRGPRLRQIPLRLMVPNLITVLSICAGLTGIRLAFEGRFETAVAMVLAAALLDGIDGRVARLLKATSRFGVQMDSLADIVNFGVAPALISYAFLLDRAGSVGWIAALIYAVSAGLRLARFNVMAERSSIAPHDAAPDWQAEFFVGVPAPLGALLVLLPVYLGFLGLDGSQFFVHAGMVYTVAIALLLVSRLPVWSGKSIRVRRDLAAPILLCGVLYVALLMTFTWQMLALTAIAYLAMLPFSARDWRRRYGTAPIVGN